MIASKPRDSFIAKEEGREDIELVSQSSSKNSMPESAIFEKLPVALEDLDILEELGN